MITIKKIALALVAGALFSFNAFAQDHKDERTITTKIADLLAQLPAKDAAQLDRNMGEVADLGEEGYVTLITGLVAPGKGDNSKIEYAVSGFTGAASAPGHQAWRDMALRAYCKALGKAVDPQNKVFIISQFEVLGNDASVDCLRGYLTDNQLADEASRALVKINTPASVAALLEGLGKASGKAKLSVAEALGHTRSAQAAAALAPLASGSDPELAKVSLYALANIADPSSADVLMAAAEKAGYKYDKTNSVGSLLIYARALKDKELALKIARTIMEKTRAEDLVNVRSGALEILASDDQKALLDAMSDPQFEYRAAAIRYAQEKLNNNNSAEWADKLGKADGQTKVLILGLLAGSGSQSALPSIIKQFKDKDASVRAAAYAAAAKVGEEQALDALITAMGKGDTSDVRAVSHVLLTMKGNESGARIAPYLPKAKPEVRAALIDVMAARASSGQVGVVHAYLTDKNPVVRKAAFTALRDISVAGHKQSLFDLLNRTTDPSELTAVQDGIISAVRDTENPDAEAEVIQQQMDKSAADKKLLYYKVLGSIGGKKALDAVNQAYASGDAATKKAALDALTSWNDASSLESLIRIARNTQDAQHVEQALSGYLRLVRATDYPAEQRLLLLRNAMDVAKTSQQKQQILKDVEQAKCFNSIVFAGRYLDDPAVQQAAANAVMNVALAGEYNGDIVKGLLEKTIQVITGGDAGYQKEGMRKYISSMKPGTGFVQVFNGRDLTGWKGLVADPIKRAKMTASELAEAQTKADAQARDSWKVINGELVFQSHGDNLATVKKYGDFEMLVDWKIIDDKKGEGDAGIYLRGTPQVQIWDNARTNVGAQVGSGGLYNNQVNESKPLKVADNKLDEWNTFRIIMKGDRVTVYLNGQLVTDNVVLENYWDRNLPIFAEEQIELQAHGSPVAYRDIYIKELPRPKPFELSAQEKKDGFKVLFDGTNMHSWTGNTTDYVIRDGNISIEPKPGKGSGGNLYTKEEFSDFIFRFEFKLTPGANNGLGIRAPLEGDAAYVGMELQILDNEAPIYKDLKVYQYHGSVYGTIPAKRGFLKPVGEWNYEEVIVKGPKIKVILNGTTILDGDITPFKKNGTPDHQEHPGLLRDSGHIGFLGHGSPVEFRNIRIKDLAKDKTAAAAKAAAKKK